MAENWPPNDPDIYLTDDPETQHRLIVSSWVGDSHDPKQTLHYGALDRMKRVQRLKSELAKEYADLRAFIDAIKDDQKRG